MRGLLLALVAIAGCGCALNRQYASTTSTNPTNGVVTVTVARSETVAFGDAKTVVDKTRASAGKTSSVGSIGTAEETSTQGVGEIIGTAIKTVIAKP